MLDPIFGSFELAVRFHPYQAEAISSLLAAHAHGKRRLHLVAPPGAGKTLIGLELIRRLQARAVILSPTTTIQAQWVQQLNRQLVNLDSTPAFSDWEQPPQIIGMDPALTPPILSLTYQRLAQGHDGHLRERVLELFDQLAAAGYRTLVLDECHHLLAFWAEAVKQFTQHLSDSCVIGLTATPPIDRQDKEIARLLDLVGEVDYEIPTPAVVREGYLAPFQDLVYLVRPTEAEAQFVSSAHQDLYRILQTLESQATPGAGLSFWAENWLLAPSLGNGQPIERAEVLLKAPDLAIACLRYLNHKGIYPLDTPWCPEAEDQPQLEDWARLLGAYGEAVLALEAPASWVGVKSALQQLGYQYRRRRFVPAQGAIDRVLALSAAKLRAVEAILKQEMQSMGPQLRVLILSDFETTHAPGKRAALQGILDPQAGGAVSVMRYLTAQTEFEPLNPILVTGKTLLCDDDLWPAFEAAARDWATQRQLEFNLDYEVIDGFYRVLGRGRDWSSQTYLALVTELLQQGLTRCLIGTRGLLGEGWDCASLNTLIDLTAVSSFVSVNQMRGRSLRQDPQQPGKVANNWDIVALMPELEGGYRDLERLQRKHQHFFGLADDGRLEKGLGHVHPLFERFEKQALLQYLDQLNQDMLSRAGERGKAYTGWRVGAPYRNRELTGLQIQWGLGRLPAATQAGAKRLVKPLASPDLSLIPLQQAASKQALDLRLQHTQETRHWLYGLNGITTLGIGLLNPFLAMGVGALSLGLTYWWSHSQQQDLALDQQAAGALVQALAQVVLSALQAAELMSPDLNSNDILLSRRQDGSLRLALPRAEAPDTRLFSQALQELLAPLQEQRYLLVFEQVAYDLQRRHWWQNLQWVESQRLEVCLPLPRLLARSRGQANLFLQAFEARIAPAQILYTRQGAGREWLQNYARQRAIPARLQQVQIWE